MLCYNILSHLPWILVNFSLDSTHNFDSSVGLSTGASVATGDRGGSGWGDDCCYTHDKVLLVRFPGVRSPELHSSSAQIQSPLHQEAPFP